MTMTATSTPTLIAASAEPDLRPVAGESRSASRVAIGVRRPSRAAQRQKNGASKMSPGMRSTIPRTSSGVPPLPLPLLVPPGVAEEKNASDQKDDAGDRRTVDLAGRCRPTR